MERRRQSPEASPRRFLFALRLPAARAILLLLAVLLAAGPFTERFWGWDHFLNTGRDFEFTVLGILLFCSLTLLASCEPSVRRSPLLLLRGVVRWLRKQRTLARMLVQSVAAAAVPESLHDTGEALAGPMPLRV